MRRLATQAGWKNGARLPDTVYGGELYFADQDWKEPNRTDYVRAVRIHKPVMATVLDWEREEQFDEVMDWADEVACWVKRAVVVIPKVPGKVHLIPNEVRHRQVILGYSVPTGYGGSPVLTTEFGSRPVHLLGGSPQAQRLLGRTMNVVTADSGMILQQARAGRFWSAEKTSKGHWNQLSSMGYHGGYLQACKLSFQQVPSLWDGYTGPDRENLSWQRSLF